MHGFVSYRRFKKARLLRSDRAVFALGRYVATEPCLRLVATDRAMFALGRYVATELRRELRSLRSDQLVRWLLRGNLVRVFLQFFVNVFSPQDSS
ncbi:hypothetical protein F2Q68_00004639 [Brassica cretica]|uniref:Uncharacterized protein n=1 Tax=Brassica cretica TaxID=69181 RepID=A0A8S9J4P5_BRACR|nr:hypothetical protein F2Q68_00004639 [Brassica cretica]